MEISTRVGGFESGPGTEKICFTDTSEALRLMRFIQKILHATRRQNCLFKRSSSNDKFENSVSTHSDRDSPSREVLMAQVFSPILMGKSKPAPLLHLIKIKQLKNDLHLNVRLSLNAYLNLL